MKDLLSSSAYLVVNKTLARQVGLKAAVLLADLISKEQYFMDNGMIKDGWFFNTEDNILKDTTLSCYKQRTAIKTLKEHKLLKVKRMGIPAKQHFKIDEEQVIKLLNNKSLKKSTTLNKNKQIKLKNKSLSIRAQEFTEEVFMSNLETEVCQDFVDYWTETNKSNTKMKFELQKTFDIKRRLARWVSNNKKWNIKQSSKIDQQLDNYQKAIDIIKKSNL
tara:strand:- start:788 stop:1444 length:657 start_codon:yes stop_codon:yes gene_type:complete